MMTRAHESPQVKQGETRWTLERPQDAPWVGDIMTSGRLPTYVFAHANPEQFGVSVNNGSRWRPKWVTVHIDGETYGRLLAVDKHFARAAMANPGAPLILLSCESAMHDGSAARAAAEYLHGDGGVTGTIYAATGDVIVPRPGEGLAELAVVANEDAAGNPLPLFKGFPAPRDP